MLNLKILFNRGGEDMKKKSLKNIKEHSAPTEELPVRYIIKTSIEEVENEEVLFLSFFGQAVKNEKADFNLYIWGNNYITQKLQKDGTYKWSSAWVYNLICWYPEKLATGTLMKKDRKNIEKVINIKCPESGDELGVIGKFQQKIMQDKLNIKHQKIKKRIDDVMEKVEELPKDFDKWIHSGPFGYSRYIYYKRETKKIVAFCTECKKEFAIVETKSTKKEIKHNNIGRCPECNKKIVYKAVGKTKNLCDDAYFAIMQKYEDGLIIRYFSGIKTYREHYKNPSLRRY